MLRLCSKMALKAAGCHQASLGYLVCASWVYLTLFLHHDIQCTVSLLLSFLHGNQVPVSFYIIFCKVTLSASWFLLFFVFCTVTLSGRFYLVFCTDFECKLVLLFFFFCTVTECKCVVVKAYIFHRVTIVLRIIYWLALNKFVL